MDYRASITASSSRNAVNNSSPRTIKRVPSPRCASPMQIVPPWESIAETQSQLHPVLGTIDHLRRGFVRFKLFFHLLQARSEHFNLFLLACDGRLQLLL